MLREGVGRRREEKRRERRRMEEAGKRQGGRRRLARQHNVARHHPNKQRGLHYANTLSHKQNLEGYASYGNKRGKMDQGVEFHSLGVEFYSLVHFTPGPFYPFCYHMSVSLHPVLWNIAYSDRSLLDAHSWTYMPLRDIRR